MSPLFAMAWLALMGCDTEQGDTAIPTCTGESPDVLLVMRQLDFAQKDDDGIAWGFDLDDHISDGGSSAGCGKMDLEDPAGNEGIDNALAWLLPAVENTEAVAILDLLQDAADAGELLAMVELYGVDDTVDDDCVTAMVSLADGDPLMGTDGLMLDGQSFVRDPDATTVELAGSLQDGVFVADGLELLLAMQVLDAELELDITQGALRVELDEDGRTASGVFGGAVSTDYIMEIVDANAIDDELTELLRDLLPLTADIEDETGECALLSMAIEYQAVEAYYYTDEERR